MNQKSIVWVKVFKNGPGKICGRRSIKNLNWFIIEYFDPFSTA